MRGETFDTQQPWNRTGRRKSFEMFDVKMFDVTLEIENINSLEVVLVADRKRGTESQCPRIKLNHENALT